MQGVPLISEKRSQIDFNWDKIRDVTQTSTWKRKWLKTQIVNYINGDIKMDEIDMIKEILEEQIILLNLLLMENKNEMR